MYVGSREARLRKPTGVSNSRAQTSTNRASASGIQEARTERHREDLVAQVPIYAAAASVGCYIGSVDNVVKVTALFEPERIRERSRDPLRGLIVVRRCSPSPRLLASGIHAG